MSKQIHKIILNISDDLKGATNHHIRWKDHIGDVWYIEYKNEKYEIIIDDVYDKNIVYKRYDKKVIISITMMSLKLRFQQKYGWCNAGKLLYLISDNVAISNNKYKTLINYKYSIGQRIQYDNVDYIITGQYIRQSSGINRIMYNMHCNICGWDGYISQRGIDLQVKCACCANSITIKGINDIATTDSWAIPYFKNINDTYINNKGSYHRVNMICPYCDTEYPNMMIRTFFMNVYHLDCPCNSSYKSYPERFVFNVLKQLNLKIIPQASCNILKWCKKYKYDFYLLNENTIIEANGIQHYTKTFNNKNFEEEQENDYQKAVLAINNDIEHYIMLDCRFSNMEYIKRSIMTSALPDILNFDESMIDWDECDKQATSNFIKNICDYYMNHENITKYDLSEIFGIKPQTVCNYLKRGRKNGFCDYDPYSPKGMIFGRQKTS